MDIHKDNSAQGEIYSLVKDTNKRLRRLERREKRKTIGTLIKWFIYIAIAVGTYYYIQPYIEIIQNMYAQIQEASQGINDIKNTATGGVSDILQKLNIGN